MDFQHPQNTNLPGLVFWKDVHSKFLACNENFAALGNLGSNEQITGLSDYDLPWHDYADVYIQHDQDVLSGIQYAKFDLLPTAQHELKTVIAIKKPIIKNDQVTALMCCCYEINNNNQLALLKILNNDVLFSGQNNSCIVTSTYYWRNELDQITKLSKRESQCLYFCLRGHSAKTTGNHLHLSPKTVESHLDSAKIKTGCANKVELFEFAYHHNFINMVPESIFKLSFSLS